MDLSAVGGDVITSKFKVETQSMMVNAYYDIDTKSKFIPYVGAGLGYAKVKASLRAEDSLSIYYGRMDDKNFA